MAEISAQDVKALREATGAGIMDAKRALVETDNNPEEATKWLRERGLGKAAERSDRHNAEGVVTVATSPDAHVAALVEVKCESDFVAKTPQLVGLAQEIAEAVVTQGDQAVEAKKDALDNAKITLKENIELGRVIRFEAASGNVLATYLHVQSGRGVNGILVEVASGSAEMAHDIAVHIAFGQPEYLNRNEVPPEAVAAERSALEAETRNEGKPEAAMQKIVEGRLNGWYKRVPGGVLLEQPFAKDDKKTVTAMLGEASIVRFAQARIGA
ncbi:MAG: translation elongation factor Ts [Actinomycetota bacterium]|nr:translation elongation factor Ts [Actinomycetota bacterium]